MEMCPLKKNKNITDTICIWNILYQSTKLLYKPYEWRN